MEVIAYGDLRCGVTNRSGLEGFWWQKPCRYRVHQEDGVSDSFLFSVTQAAALDNSPVRNHVDLILNPSVGCSCEDDLEYGIGAIVKLDFPLEVRDQVLRSALSPSRVDHRGPFGWLATRASFATRHNRSKLIACRRSQPREEVPCVEFGNALIAG